MRGICIVTSKPIADMKRGCASVVPDRGCATWVSPVLFACIPRGRGSCIREEGGDTFCGLYLGLRYMPLTVLGHDCSGVELWPWILPSEAAGFGWQRGGLLTADYC